MLGCMICELTARLCRRYAPRRRRRMTRKQGMHRGNNYLGIGMAMGMGFMARPGDRVSAIPKT